MPRDGSGDYSRAVTPPTNGDVASATDFNSEINDIGQALSDSININGTKAFAADQSMGGYKLTNLAAPSSANDAARKAYVDSTVSAASFQPLDATLTALAALSWSSGSPVLQFTAADTVSLTLTPSVTSVTATGAVAAGGAVSGTTFTPSGSTPPTNGLYLPATNTLGWAINSAGEMQLTASALSPISSGGLALGTTSLMWAGAFLSASSALNWNNGDVTVTHSTNALAFAGASSGYSFDAAVTITNAATAATLTNNADNANNIVLRLDSDRATPTAGDTAFLDVRLSDSAGNQDLFCRIGVTAATVTSGSESANLGFTLMKAGVSTALLTLSGSGSLLAPSTNDGLALGSTSLGWSDLHVATGFVFNVANGLVTVTHDAANDRLVLAGGSLKARPSISTDTGGTLTSASDNCIVDLASAPTINDGIHEAGSIIVLVNNTASSMTITQDTGMTLRLHGTSTTGNLTLNARGIATVQIDPVSNAEAICTGDVS